MPAIYTKGKKYGAASQTIKELTKAEYDSLTEEQKKNGIIYMVTDEDSAEDIHVVNEVMDDEYTVPTSKAVYNAIQGLPDVVQHIEDSADTIPSSKAVYRLAHNKNLLDNWWFENPINQRGFVSNEGGASGFTIDRWFKDATCRFYKREGYIEFWSQYSNQVISQVLEEDTAKLMLGKQCTLSVKLYNDVIISETFLCPSSLPTSDQQLINMNLGGGYFAQFILKSGLTRLRFRRPELKDESSLQMKAVKLEIGSASTLANDTAPDYATELLKCQRYFYRLKAKSNSYQETSSLLDIDARCTTSKILVAYIILPVEMRALPTMTYNSISSTYLTAVIPLTGAGYSFSSFSMYINDTRMPAVTGVMDTSATLQHTIGILRLSNGGYLDFSADL